MEASRGACKASAWCGVKKKRQRKDSGRQTVHLRSVDKCDVREEDKVMLPVVFSFIALCISCVALWKGHFARFSPLALAGNLRHRVYPIRNGDRRWYITSFDIPVSVTNPGARPGLVTGLRLRLHYPELPFAGNHELISAKWELRPDKLNQIDSLRVD